MTEDRTGALAWLLLFFFALLTGPTQGQDARKVPISFLPPPLETATFSLGIYDSKTGKLVRRLKEAATQDAFTVGLNGLSTSWDGKDDDGKPVPPGKYAARGYAVGALKVEGEQILGNDWANDDENLRINYVSSIAIVPEDNGLAVLGLMMTSDSRDPEDGSKTWAHVARYGGAKTELLWQKPSKKSVVTTHVLTGRLAFSVRGGVVDAAKWPWGLAFALADGSETTSTSSQAETDDDGASSSGKDGTVWKIEEGRLSQYSGAERLRILPPKEGDPKPIAVTASKTTDRLYILERKDDWTRVRGLSWMETKEEEGKPISTWQTFFERNIRQINPLPSSQNSPSAIEINLVENPLDPGKLQKIRLDAGFDEKGSYLTTADGLRLRRISQRDNLGTAKLLKGKTANSLTFYQSDRAAWDEFSITGAKNMMAFDAGEFEMTADGEKLHTEKAAEPSDEP